MCVWDLCGIDMTLLARPRPRLWTNYWGITQSTASNRITEHSRHMQGWIFLQSCTPACKGKWGIFKNMRMWKEIILMRKTIIFGFGWFFLQFSCNTLMVFLAKKTCSLLQFWTYNIVSDVNYCEATHCHMNFLEEYPPMTDGSPERWRT